MNPVSVGYISFDFRASALALDAQISKLVELVEANRSPRLNQKWRVAFAEFYVRWRTASAPWFADDSVLPLMLPYTSDAALFDGLKRQYMRWAAQYQARTHEVIKDAPRPPPTPPKPEKPLLDLSIPGELWLIFGAMGLLFVWKRG